MKKYGGVILDNIKNACNEDPSLKTLQVGSVELAYHDVGDGPLVILLHGFPDTAYTWKKTQTILKDEGYRSIALYLRGYFPSEIPADGDYSLSTLVSDVIKLVEKLGYKKCILIGHDWGAMITYAAALLYPNIVTKIITLAIPPPQVSHTNLRERIVRPHNIYLGWGKIAHWWLKKKEFKALDFFYRQWSPNWLIPQEHMKHIKQVFSLPGRAAAAVDYYSAPMGKEVESIINSAITQPTLVIYGLDEPKVRLSMFSNAESVLTDTSVVSAFKKAGHWPHRESPIKFHQELVKFLAETSIS